MLEDKQPDDWKETMGKVEGFTVGWFTLALINAGLAECKGRSRFTWFMVSMLLGPAATFILVVFTERRR